MSRNTPAAPSDVLPPGPFNDLLDRATRRLAGDPELRLEVANELRGHLEDSAREYRDAGLGELEAVAESAKALGDADDLAERLWSANRRNLRRRAAARWAARLTLAPAAAVLCVTAAHGVLTVLALLMLISGGFTHPSQVGISQLAHDAWERAVARMPEEDQLFFRGPEGVPPVEGARVLAERWPHDRALRANYVGLSLRQKGLFTDPRDTDPVALRQLVMLIDEAAALEPDNAHYPLLKAAALLTASSRMIEEPDTDVPGYPTTDWKGSPTRRALYRVEVVDPAMFDRGLAALHEAAGKPYLESYAVELARRRADRLPPATEFSDHLVRQTHAISTLFPHLKPERHAFERALGYAVGLATAGEGARAEALWRDARRLATMAAARAGLVLELSSARHLRLLADTAEAVSLHQLGRREQSRHAEQRLRDQERLWVESRHRDIEAALRRLPEEAGAVQGIILTPATDFSRVDLRPGRRAEYAVADRAGLTGLLALLLAAAAGLVLWPAARRWHKRWQARRHAQRNAQPGAQRLQATATAPSLSLGWKGTAKAVMLGGLAPVAAYAVYAWLTPLGGRGRGLTWTWQRLALEYASVAAVVVVLVHVLTARGLRRRAAEVGVAPDVPRPRSGRGQTLAGLLIAAAVLGVIVAWHVANGYLLRDAHDASPLLQGCTAAVGAAALLYAFWRLVAGARYGVVGVHAFAVAFAATALVVGGAGTALLRWEERREVARFEEAGYDLLSEMEFSRLRTLRDQAAEELRRTPPTPRATTSPA